MNIKKLLGKKIKEIRKNKKLTQEHLAEQIGLEPVSISNIENGKYYPSADNLEKIIKALEITPSELYNFEYLAEPQDLIGEMNEKMSKDDNLVRLMYKFFTLVKNWYWNIFFCGKIIITHILVANKRSSLNLEFDTTKKGE